MSSSARSRASAAESAKAAAALPDVASLPVVASIAAPDVAEEAVAEEGAVEPNAAPVVEHRAPVSITTSVPAASSVISSGGARTAAAAAPATAVPDTAPPGPQALPELTLVPALEPPTREPAARPPRRTAASRRPAAATAPAETALKIEGLSKRYGSKYAVRDIRLDVPAGSFFGFVGPNGAGKTTTLSMVTGLVRPDSGSITVHGIDVWKDARRAKPLLGVLPDRLRLFDRLTGAQLLAYAGSLRGLDRATSRARAEDLAVAFGLTPSLDRFVSDYSAGMTKKIALAAAMIHSPRVLVLDEPFETVDPVSSAVVVGVLQRFTQVGGTVIMSSHSMELIERVCDSVAVIADGSVLAAGPIDGVLEGASLEQRFVELAGGTTAVEGMEWLQSFSD